MATKATTAGRRPAVLLSEPKQVQVKFIAIDIVLSVFARYAIERVDGTSV